MKLKTKSKHSKLIISISIGVVSAATIGGAVAGIMLSSKEGNKGDNVMNIIESKANSLKTKFGPDNSELKLFLTDNDFENLSKDEAPLTQEDVDALSIETSNDLTLDLSESKIKLTYMINESSVRANKRFVIKIAATEDSSKNIELSYTLRKLTNEELIQKAHDELNNALRSIEVNGKIVSEHNSTTLDSNLQSEMNVSAMLGIDQKISQLFEKYMSFHVTWDKTSKGKVNGKTGALYQLTFTFSKNDISDEIDLDLYSSDYTEINQQENLDEFVNSLTFNLPSKTIAQFDGLIQTTNSVLNSTVATNFGITIPSNPNNYSLEYKFEAGTKTVGSKVTYTFTVFVSKTSLTQRNRQFEVQSSDTIIDQDVEDQNAVNGVAASITSVGNTTKGNVLASSVVNVLSAESLGITMPTQAGYTLTINSAVANDSAGTATIVIRVSKNGKFALTSPIVVSGYKTSNTADDKIKESIALINSSYISTKTTAELARFGDGSAAINLEADLGVQNVVNLLPSTVAYDLIVRKHSNLGVYNVTIIFNAMGTTLPTDERKAYFMLTASDATAIGEFVSQLPANEAEINSRNTYASFADGNAIKANGQAGLNAIGLANDITIPAGIEMNFDTILHDAELQYGIGTLHVFVYINRPIQGGGVNADFKWILHGSDKAALMEAEFNEKVNMWKTWLSYDANNPTVQSRHNKATLKAVQAKTWTSVSKWDLYDQLGVGISTTIPNKSTGVQYTWTPNTLLLVVRIQTGTYLETLSMTLRPS